MNTCKTRIIYMGIDYQVVSGCCGTGTKGMPVVAGCRYLVSGSGVSYSGFELKVFEV